MYFPPVKENRRRNTLHQIVPAKATGISGKLLGTVILQDNVLVHIISYV